MAPISPAAELLRPLLYILNGVATTGKTPMERILGLFLLVLLVVALVALATLKLPEVGGGVAGLALLLLHEWGKPAPHAPTADEVLEAATGRLT